MLKITLKKTNFSVLYLSKSSPIIVGMRKFGTHFLKGGTAYGKRHDSRKPGENYLEFYFACGDRQYFSTVL